jgi:hypothetical protein
MKASHRRIGSNGQSQGDGTWSIGCFFARSTMGEPEARHTQLPDNNNQ